MKKIVVMLAMSLMNVAYADNLPLTGYYAGVNTGVAFNDATVTAQQLGFTNASNTCNKNAGYSNALSGVQLGYLYQFSNAIISGVEINTTMLANPRGGALKAHDANTKPNNLSPAQSY